MITSARVPIENGDWVNIRLDPHETQPESENVLEVHVRRRGGRGSTLLGRIDTREHVYHVRHQDLADFVRWSDRTVTLGIEELILANANGAKWVEYLDERNETRYRATMADIRGEGYAVMREKIGWRWAVPLDLWTREEKNG